MERSKSCKRCGTCCCDFPIFEHEAKKIQQYIENRPDLLKQLYRGFDVNGCIFLLPGKNGTWNCSIYDSGVRPLVCKVFGTKGLSELKCPQNSFVGTKYTRKQAMDLLKKNAEKGRPVGMMNSVMLPFVARSLKKHLMEEIFSK